MKNRNFIEFTKYHDKLNMLFDIDDIRGISEQPGNCTILFFYSDIKTNEIIAHDYKYVIQRLKELR